MLDLNNWDSKKQYSSVNFKRLEQSYYLYLLTKICLVLSLKCDAPLQRLVSTFYLEQQIGTLRS